MQGDHALASTEKNLDDGRYRARCRCGYRSGWRQTKAIAIRVVGSHVDKQVATMTAAKAQAITFDCSEGLHEEFLSPEGCTYPGCSDAYFMIARIAEERVWIDWKVIDAQRRRLES